MKNMNGYVTKVHQKQNMSTVQAKNVVFDNPLNIPRAQQR